MIKRFNRLYLLAGYNDDKPFPVPAGKCFVHPDGGDPIGLNHSDMLEDKFPIRGVTIHIEAPTLRTIAIAKADKLSDIKMAFSTEMANGKVATGLGWDIDARSPHPNDHNNMVQLYLDMLSEGEMETYVKGADNVLHLCTIEQIQSFDSLLRKIGRARYNKKFVLEAQVNDLETNTFDKIDAISW